MKAREMSRYDLTSIISTVKEIIVKLPAIVDEELLETLKKDIDVVVRLRIQENYC